MAERTIHGPIFQFECEDCDYMGDCWETEAEAVADMESHDCVACAPAWVRDEIERLRAVVDALIARPFRGTSLERRDRMYGSDWETVHDALDALEARRG